MAGQAYNVGIEDSWTLMQFARMKGKMQVGSFTNSENGKKFKSCIFTNPENGSRCFVSFSSKLGELTPSQISAMKNDLQVVLLESGHYSLCKRGQSEWEDVDL